MQQMENTIILKVGGQGFDISIHGKKDPNGNWVCAVERNEIVLSDQPDSDFIKEIEQERHYNKTDFTYSFEEAFKKLDQSEWFLCHPGKMHPEFADFILDAFEKRMSDYELQFPAESPMEEFVCQSRKDEWKKKADLSKAPKT